MPLPTEPGLYLAKMPEWSWYPLTFRVSGEAPYLTISLLECRTIEGTERSNWQNLEYTMVANDRHPLIDTSPTSGVVADI